MEMTMEQFVKQYAENLLKTLREHDLGVDGVNWYCCLCPLQEQCEKDTQDNPEGNSSCGGFIRRTVTDGIDYRV